MEKLNHTQLEYDISDLRVKNNLASVEYKVTFTNAENILAAFVSSLPDYQSKSWVVSGVGTNSNGDIHRDGNIFTSYYKNWSGFSK